MRRLLAALLGFVTGYVLFACAGYGLIEWGSSNQFDRSLEAAATAAFVFGPAGALVGFIGGLLLGGRRARTSA
jgi:hypothetical protein